MAGAGRAAWTRLLVVAHSWLRGELLSLCCSTENSEEFLFPPPLFWCDRCDCLALQRALAQGTQPGGHSST